MLTLLDIYGNAPFWRPAGGQVTSSFLCIWNSPLQSVHTLLQQLAVTVTTGRKNIGMFFRFPGCETLYYGSYAPRFPSNLLPPSSEKNNFSRDLIFVVPCIMLNSEINPTRCNNCVYSSQWLYSTCFG